MTRVLLSCMLCFGLLMVDGIHFQYNGYLLSMLFICLALLYARRLMAASAVYTLLVLSKHLFLAAGPAIAIFLVAAACEGTRPHQRASLPRILARLAGMASAVGAVFVTVCWPWLSTDVHVMTRNAAAIASRLFPFQRGLVHAYWAPNVWALYLSADKMVAAIARRAGFTYLLHAGIDADGALMPSVQASHSAHVTLVHALQALPQPTAAHCIVMILLTCAPVWYWLAHQCTPARAHVAVCLCMFMFFAFGFHTHEKAILYALLPLLPLTCLTGGGDLATNTRAVDTVAPCGALQGMQRRDTDADDITLHTACAACWHARIHALIDWCLPASSIAIMPLIFPLPEQPILILGLIAHYAWYYCTCAAAAWSTRRVITVYHAAGVLAVALYYALPLVVPHLPFLPLLCISVYCALGVMCGVAHALLLVCNLAPVCEE